ncbi:MAG TPA: ATPase, T2SS/T4P/T4SS family, partial [Candidatus Babeliales bacterium]|nr:ATPase, T2SS/T4P/T4SS family [Candidatus Babeliales bacterium]
LITPVQLAEAYSAQLNLPYIEKIDENLAAPNLLKKVSFRFLRENNLIPIKKDGQVYVITADPYQYQAIDDLILILNERATPAVATAALIADSLNRFYPLEETSEMLSELEQTEGDGAIELGEVADKDILSMAQEAPIIKLVNQILIQAVKRDASDIHVEPLEKEVRVRFRIDGVMHQLFTPPKRIQDAMLSRIKIMANLNIAEKRLPQDGRINLKIAAKPIDLRVSTLPTTYGEKIVLRLLDKSKNFGKLTELGFTKHDFQIIEHAISQPNGIILVSGPTGSGKTSTLYSVLSELNQPDVNIITVEDPVEYQMKGVTQVQVNTKIELTFAVVLRAVLRQDPDIIMIGETRDHETAQIATQASLTGHLVLSTIHTNSAPATITRLIDMGIEPFLIASTISCILAQRLVRKLHDCKVAYQPPLAILKKLGISEAEAQKITFYQPQGCPDCDQTGYRGRLAIFEVMPMSGAIAKLTIERADANLIKQAAIKEGMTLLVQDGITKIKAGLTSIEEVLSVATSQESFE